MGDGRRALGEGWWVKGDERWMTGGGWSEMGGGRRWEMRAGRWVVSEAGLSVGEGRSVINHGRWAAVDG